MQKFYRESFLVTPPVVLGRQLCALSCGHAYLLAAIESPFVDGGEPTWNDFLAAIWICSQPWRDALKQMQQPGKWEKEVKKWGYKQRKADPFTAIEAFGKYHGNYLQGPPTWKSDKVSKAPRVPWIFALVWSVANRVDLDKVWDMPLTQAIAYQAAQRAEDGDELLMSEEEELRNEAIRKLHAS